MPTTTISDAPLLPNSSNGGIGKFLLGLFGQIVVVVILIVIYHFAIIAPEFTKLKCIINPYSNECPLYNNNPTFNMQNYTTPSSRQTLPSSQITTPMVRR
jgi:hypothetical protein